MKEELKSLLESLSQIPFPILAILAILLSTVVAYTVRKVVSKLLTKTAEHLNVAPTNYTLLKNASGFLVFGFSMLILTILIPQLSSFGTGLFASAGIFAAVIGFASQAAFSNIIGGIFIVIFKPFRVGDFIEVGTFVGTVEDITLRHTVIKDVQNKRIIIPNSSISSETIVNNHITDERLRRRIEFRVALDTDMDKASIIIVEEILKHPNSLDTRTDEEKEKGVPIVAVKLTLIGDYFLNLMVYAWSPTPALSYELFCDVNKTIVERFRKEGIEIPVPGRKVIQG